MKTLIIGDIHGRDTWEKILQKNTDAKRVIFIGDYFDNHLIPYTKQIENFNKIVQFKAQHIIEVIMLIGNHDHHYFPDVIKDNMAKYASAESQSVITTISAARHNLQMAFQMGNILFTHAGVGKTFLDREIGPGSWNVDNLANDINALFRVNPKAFKFKGFNPTGEDIGQTPIWIRPTSLMLDAISLKNKIIQVVGHTPMETIPTPDKMGSGRYYFIDTLGSSCEYLIVDTNGNIKIQSFYI